MKAPTHYQVNEHFWTLQGEGKFAGHTAIFIRLQGCPIGCEWCDSKLTWYKGGTKMSLQDIQDMIVGYPESDLVVITGGEPLVWDLDPLIALIERVRPRSMTQLETSGALPFKGRFLPDSIIVSPKFAADWKLDPFVLAKAAELKYVVDETFEPEIVWNHITHLNDYHVDRGEAIPLRALPIVSLMPEGSPPRPEMVEKTIEILKKYPHWRFSPRLQYAYPNIGKLEGRNNAIITKADAREHARTARNPKS